MSIILKTKSLYETFKGRHRWIPERLDHAARFASQHEHDAKEIAEVLSINTDPGDEWGPQTTGELNFDYAKFCVNWISQLADGTKWLIKIGLDENHAWYVREEAFLCIAHLKPTDILDDDWSNIIAFTVAEGILEIDGEIRSAALKALVDNQTQHALPALQNLYDQSGDCSKFEDEFENDWIDSRRKLMLACAVLGSNSLIPNVIDELFNRWWHHREAATQSMDLIATRMGGAENIAKELLAQAKLDSQSADPWNALKEHPNFAVVRWSLIYAPGETVEQFEELIELLGHENWGIRTEAANEIAKVPTTMEQATKKLLDSTFQDQSTSRLKRSWCAYALYRLGQKVDSIFPAEQREEMKEVWQTPWPFKINPAIRNAIVWAYGHPDEPGTDVRYHLEQKMTIEYQEEQATADRNQLIDALQVAGVAVTSVQDCGDYHQQGSGTYWILGLGREASSNQLYVSTLGKFVCYVEVSRHSTETSYSEGYNFGPDKTEIKDEAQASEQDVCNKVAAELGFIFLDRTCLQLTIPGLKVYLFSHDEPPIRELLFYWTS